VKAVVYSEYGSPGVLRLEEVERPTPREGKVLVAVHASSVNSWDWDLLRGVPVRLGRPRHPILGADVAGRVEAVGPQVKDFAPGDEVFGDLSGCGWGGFAEYVCASAAALARKPAGLSFEEAAAVPQAAVLALQGLRYRGGLREGRRVLVNGAGGGVGTFAVQMARASGAEVTAVDAAGKLEMLRSIGADRVMDYAREDFTREGSRYDLILDVVARRSPGEYARALSPRGICAIIGGSGAAVLQAVLLGPWFSVVAGRKVGLVLHRPNRPDLESITGLIEAGKVVPVIHRRYPLAEVPAALRYFGEGLVKGKLVISVRP
jgi:NADPH:quinone reductase-like Zn-dependent oxidoreductase